MSDLFKEIKIGNTRFSNRIVMAPLTRARSGENRVPNSLMKQYYQQRSSAGLILSEATVISKQGIGWVNTPGIYSSEQVAGWKKITDAVKEKSGKIFLQLWHCGRASHSDFLDGQATVAPSAIAIQDGEIHTPQGKKKHETPRALDISEIKSIIEDYYQASVKAKDAGFDGIEIHSANGYLLDTFLQSKTNTRTDDYGGSIENRCRLLSEIIDRVKTVWQSDQISVRLSPNGNFNDMGSDDFREQFIAVTQMIEKNKIGILHVMDGLGFGFHEKGEPMTLSDFRKIYSGVIIGNCGYTREKAIERVDNGDADMIAFGRPYISNPDLAERLINNYELNPDAPMDVWYDASKGEKGYIDFPIYEAN
jgi:N-ethylmaleimide reductase